MIGPLYLRAEQKHCNMRGTVHGGMLATLADITIGYSLAFSTLEAAVEFHKLGARVAFGSL